jgi:hypothetical protein
MLFLLQVPQLSTGNPKLDAIAQASALGLTLAGVLIKTFGKKQTPKRPVARATKTPRARATSTETQSEVDDTFARR